MVHTLRCIQGEALTRRGLYSGNCCHSHESSFFDFLTSTFLLCKFHFWFSSSMIIQLSLTQTLNAILYLSEPHLAMRSCWIFFDFDLFLIFRLQIFYLRNSIFDFHLQWLFNAMGNLIHAYYCYRCWLGDPLGHLEVFWIYFDCFFFRLQLFCFGNIISDFHLQWSFNTMVHLIHAYCCYWY